MRCFVLLVLALGVAACSAPRVAPTRAMLEARVAENGRDADALRDLGALLALDGEYGPAFGALVRALALQPTDGHTLYLTGLTQEASGQPDQAETFYARYLTVPEADAYRDSLKGRLDGLIRTRLRVSFATALMQDSVVANPAQPGTVGVLPFGYRGDNAEYTALGRGLAEVLSVDLAAVEGLTVVERARLQALLAESDMARAGVLDPATAPRTGRLLGAASMIGGEVDVQGDALRIESAVWADTLLSIETSEGGVADLFRIQRTIALDVLETLGISVAQADRARAAPTEDLAAFLAFSRGLLLDDTGDYVGAAAQYDQALSLDPAFALAAQRRSDAALAAASGAPARTTLAATAESSIEPIAFTVDIVRLRADRTRTVLGDNLPPGSEAREPGVEGSRAGILGDLPDPPPPPTTDTSTGTSP